jgi:hypothetical protein
MATDFLFIDGFDHLGYGAAGTCMDKWTNEANNASGARGTTTGRLGTGAAMRCGTGSSGWRVTRKLLHPSNTYTKLLVGVAFRTSELDSSVLCLDSGTAVTGSGHTEVYYNAAGFIELRRNGTVIATTAGTYSQNTWYYFELKVLIASGATGSYELRIGGTAVLGPTSSVQTCSQATVNTIRLSSSANNDGSGNSYDWDDLVVQDWNTAGVDFLGDVNVVTLRPSGAGNYTDGTPSAGSNYQNVDDTTANDDTDYNTLDAVSERDSFALGDLPSAGQVHGVQLVTRYRKADAGVRTMRQFFRISGSNYEGASATVYDSYTLQREVFNTNPAGGAWTDSIVNALEVGYKAQT